MFHFYLILLSLLFLSVPSHSIHFFFSCNLLSFFFFFFLVTLIFWLISFILSSFIPFFCLHMFYSLPFPSLFSLLLPLLIFHSVLTYIFSSPCFTRLFKSVLAHPRNSTHVVSSVCVCVIILPLFMHRQGLSVGGRSALVEALMRPTA